jgi:hypothetical protein
MNEFRVSPRLLNRLTAEIASWLEGPHPDRTLDAVGAWDQVTWRIAERVVWMHGVGPYLHDALARTPIHAALPDTFRQWLALQYEMNGMRVQRLYEELAAILREAGRAGVAVVPLKGSVLSTRYYTSPALRPMADLDILIQPHDEPALAGILEELGYQYQASTSRHAHPANFVKPGGTQVVSWHGIHPDNPRFVEVHTQLAKALWYDVGSYDLTAYFWSESREDKLLGEQAWLPAPDRLLTYLATHALYHHLFQGGRLINWLDLASVAPTVRHIDPPDANWVYPSLRLAARAMPTRFTGVDLSPLAPLTHPRLRHWAESVPLDGRCGLSVDLTPPGEHKRWYLRWKRWRPARHRLALGYGHLPLPLAYGKHLITALRHYPSR